MAQVLLVRHGKKGNGIKGDGLDNGRKNLLSPRGEKDALELGKNLPEGFGNCIKYVGGSELSRSLHTALLIAMSAGSDPQVLASDRRLGSEDQLFNEFGVGLEGYIKALEENGNIEIDALRQVLTAEQYGLLRDQIGDAVCDALSLKANVILGTHSPWLQLAIESFSGKEFHANVNELDWILIDRNDCDPRIIATSLD